MEFLNNVPKDWYPAKAPCLGMHAFQSDKHKLLVIISKSKYSDNKEWMHVSVSTKNKKIPTYQQIIKVKETFIGDDKKAIQVFPEKKFHVNLHPGVLHLWCCLGDDPLPEFSGMISMGGKSFRSI